MKILVDIGHPAHVHLFKNIIWNLEKDGHEIKITAKDKEIALHLLNTCGFKYEKIGKHYKKLPHKLMGLITRDYKLYKVVKEFKADILISHGSMYAAHVAKLLGKPHISLEDTENSMEQIRLYAPFTDVILTSTCFKRDLGKKQVRYNGYHELTYLHPDHFKPDPSVLDDLGLGQDDKFIILRFVSWGASHDVGHSGLTLETKRKAVKEFEKYGEVFITSESPLPSEFEKYRIRVPPEKIHDLMYYATLLYGESATMASECAVLGTHAIFCDFAGRGYTDEQEEKYGLVFNFKLEEESQIKSVEKAVELLKDNNLEKKGEKKRKKLLSEKIDVTKFMTNFIENYPESFHEYKEGNLK